MLIDQEVLERQLSCMIFSLTRSEGLILAIKADQQLSGSLSSRYQYQVGLHQSPEHILSRLSQLGRVADLLDQSML